MTYLFLYGTVFVPLLILRTEPTAIIDANDDHNNHHHFNSHRSHYNNTQQPTNYICNEQVIVINYNSRT